MTDDQPYGAVLQNLADRLRTLSWSQRAEFLEERVLVVSLMIMEATPDSNIRRHLLRGLSGVYEKLIKRIDDGDIACLDHAALVMIFRSSHMPTAARWVQQNVSDDRLGQWLEAYPYIAVFSDMTQPGKTVALH